MHHKLKMYFKQTYSLIVFSGLLILANGIRLNSRCQARSNILRVPLPNSGGKHILGRVRVHGRPNQAASTSARWLSWWNPQTPDIVQAPTAEFAWRDTPTTFRRQHCTAMYDMTVKSNHDNHIHWLHALSLQAHKPNRINAQTDTFDSRLCGAALCAEMNVPNIGETLG